MAIPRGLLGAAVDLAGSEARRRIPRGPPHFALRCRVATALVALAVLLPQSAGGQVFTEPGFVAETVVTLPPFQLVGMVWSNDGRMFLWQKNGLVHVYHDGVLHATPFLDLRGQVNTYDDRGLLGLAVDPNFQANGYVYLAYVYEEGGNPSDSGAKISRLTRVTANPVDPDVALPGSEVILIDNLPADGGSHTAGTLRFAPDGTLFLNNGDGASAAFADPLALGAQDVDSLRGKILRINADGSAPAPPQQPNPYYDGTNSIRSKVWASGLRNAFRYDFHPTLGDLYAGEVGWNAWEEVDRIVPGGNYGWPCYEGLNAQPEYQALFPATCGPLVPSAVIPPLYTYDRSVGSAAVGGAFYTGSVYPQAYWSNFFFSDYTGGWMRRLVLDLNGGIAQNLVFATGVGVPVSTEVGPDGLLYYADFLSGEIRRIRYNGPVAVASATPRSGYSPLEVTFSSAGSIDGLGSPLSYFWDFGDGSTSTAPNPIHTYVSNQVQSYAAALTVRNSSNVTSTATVSATVGSLPPTPTILSPANGVGVQPGETVVFAGSATDPDEVLAASALSWEVLLRHNSHIHSHVGGTGSTGSFVAQYHGAGTYSYELILTATDSSGLESSTSVQIPILPDTLPPSDPANLSAAATGTSTINLGWSASTDNAAVSSYRIERCTGATCVDFAETGVSPGPTFTDAGLSPQTAYSYRVRASDPTGNLSGYSNAVSAETAGAPIQLPGLVAAYGFDEGSGSTLGDFSGNGNHGSISGATWMSSGRYGQALVFDGSNDVVVVPDSSSLDLSTGMTLEAWVYPTSSLSNWKAILQKEVDAWFLNANTSGDHPGTGGTLGGNCCTILDGPSPLATNQWTHVAGTYDGATLRLYLNGVQVASQPATGTLQVNALPLRIGGNTYSSEFFPGRIDNLRIYDRALSAAEIQQDMQTPVGGVPADVSAPVRSNGLPSGTLPAGTTQATLSLLTDEAATCRYATTPGVAYASMPGAFATTGGTSHSTPVGGLANGQSYAYHVRCQDAAGNANPSDYSIAFSVALPGDTQPPSVAITQPASGSTVSGPITVSADASDDSGTVAGVQFLLDGNALGAEDTGAPFALAWDTRGVVDGTYLLSARARDASLNTATSPAISVTVANGTIQLPGLVAAYGFDEGSGSTLGDFSGNGNHGSISGATWMSSGRYGQALVFDGSNDVVVVPDSSSLDLAGGMTLEVWVYPTGALSGWKAILQKEVDAWFLNANTSGDHAGVGGTFGGACCTILEGPSPLATNQWTHVAATYDGATLRLYLNATQVASQALTGNLQVNALPLRIGGNTYGSEFFPGRIDNLRIYDRALSAAEIQQDMQTPVGGVPADVSAPVRSNGLPSGTLPAGTTQATLGLLTDEAATCRYATTPGVAYASMPGAFATTGGTSHSTPVGGLANGQSYAYHVRCQDAAGNANPNDFPIAFSVATAQVPGLVAAYGFNEGGGSMLGDASGNGNHGSIGGATWTSAGRYGQALSFDGNNDLVVIPDSSSLDLTNGMTLEAWVHPTSALSGWKAILQKEVDAYYLDANSPGNRSAVGGTFNGACCTTLKSTAPLPINQWTHVAGTYDGVRLRLYINGTQVATRTRSGSLQINAFPLRVGGNTYSSEFFPGRIDEVRIYNRALSAAEIQQDRLAPIGP